METSRLVLQHRRTLTRAWTITVGWRFYLTAAGQLASDTTGNQMRTILTLIVPQVWDYLKKYRWWSYRRICSHEHTTCGAFISESSTIKIVGDRLFLSQWVVPMSCSSTFVRSEIPRHVYPRSQDKSKAKIKSIQKLTGWVPESPIIGFGFMSSKSGGRVPFLECGTRTTSNSRHRQPSSW